MKHVIKLSGKVQNFSSDKLKISITRSLYAVHTSDKEANIITDSIIEAIESWLSNKHEVTTKDIRAITTKELAKYNKDAAVVYKKYKDVW